jgi:C4-dicarboxylate-specific signal transduction histidine kinase
LERRVEERTSELKQSNCDLIRALDQSSRLQEAIIIKEKLASLTPMVAGVSHELNTPIGNIAVLSSALQERFHEYRQR